MTFVVLPAAQTVSSRVFVDFDAYPGLHYPYFMQGGRGKESRWHGLLFVVHFFQVSFECFCFTMYFDPYTFYAIVSACFLYRSLHYVNATCQTKNKNKDFPFSRAFIWFSASLPRCFFLLANCRRVLADQDV